MAKLIIISSGITSIVNANLAMARRLVADGHECVYASDAELRDRVESEGLEFVQLDAPVKPAAVSTDGRLQRWVNRFGDRPTRWSRERLDERFGLVHFDERVVARKPDLVLIDAELHRFVFASVGAGLRVGLTTTFVSPWRHRGVPPLHVNVPTGRAADFAWLNYRAKRAVHRIIQRLASAGNDPISLHRALAQRHNFAWSRYIDASQWQIPFFYRNLPVLVLNAAGFDYPHEQHVDARYVGPMIDVTRASDTASDAQIEAFVGRRQPDALVYSASGQFRESYDADVLRRIIAVARQRPDWDFIVVTSGVTDQADVPANALLLDRAPQLRCLELADMAIIHGGIMSIAECIAARTPMLMYSLGIRDQDGNVARAHARGLGFAGDRNGDTAEGLSAQLQRLRRNPGVDAVLADLGGQFEEYANQRILENTVAELLIGPK